jgi:poly(hydroxyalkanoate) depolymerase family esterase
METHMNGPLDSTMREAMRLMQTGDLLAATAAIQQRLGGASEPESLRHASITDPIEGTFRVIEEAPAPTQDAAFGNLPDRTPDARGRTQFSESVYIGSAGSRHYKLFVPSAYRGQPLPLIVMLHGCTQTPDDFAIGTRMNILAEDRGCFVVYPAQSRKANISRCWNWFKASDQGRDRGEPAIIAGLVRELLLTYGLDQKRVYVAGLSAGGAMGVILGRMYPDIFAAVGVHSGLPYGVAHDLPSAFAAMHGPDTADPRGERLESAEAGRSSVPAIVFHGDRDITVHPSNGEQVATETAAVNVDESSRESPAVETRTGEARGGYAYTCMLFKDNNERIVVEHWLVHGAAHAWFGGDPRGSFTDPNGPDATSEMMRFFLERTRA